MFVLLENWKKWFFLLEICGIKRDNVLGILDLLFCFCGIGFNCFFWFIGIMFVVYMVFVNYFF